MNVGASGGVLGSNTRANHEADVAVVGYGPVGQALVLSLARLGHRVVAIEKWPDLYGLPRAVGIDHEVLRILQSLGVMDEFERHLCSVSEYQWRDDKGTTLLAFKGLDRPAPSGWPSSCAFSQPNLETIMDRRIRADFANSVTVLQGWEATALNEDSNGVELRIEPVANRSEPQRTVRARYVVGCDGAGSFVRRAMGAGLHDLDFSADWLVVDIKPNNPDDCGAELIQVCDPHRPTTNVSGGPGRRRFEFMLVEGEKKEEHNNAASCWRLLAPWGWTPENCVLERHAVYTFRAAIADCWRKGRVIIAGDAAHLTPPFAAQGLCSGLRDVAALSWRLHLVLKHQFSDALLDSYEAERRVAVRPLIDLAVELGRIICVRDPKQTQERAHALFANALAGADSGFPTPRLGTSVLQRAGDQVSGTLSMQARVRVFDDIERLDDLMGRGFMLVGKDHDPMQALNSAQRAFFRSIGGRALGIGPDCQVKDIDGAYAQWFDRLGADAVLIRPDHYIYGAADAPTLIDDLQRSWSRAGYSTAA